MSPNDSLRVFSLPRSRSSTGRRRIISLAQRCEATEQLLAEGTLLLDMLEDGLHIGIAVEVATNLLEVLRLHTLIAVELDRELYADAKKEFSLSAMTGFGADGDERVQAMDFT